MTVDLRGRAMRDLRISIIDSCNFRCTYCMPADVYAEGYPFLTADKLMSLDQIEGLARVAVELGVRKIKLTGGEPLLRPQLGELIARLNALEGLEDLGLITNGFYLAPCAATLRQAGLRRITISLDTFNPKTFSAINGVGRGLHKVLDGISAARAQQFESIKINMVVQRGVNDDEVVPIARFFRGTGIILRFIEYMDVGMKHQYNSKLLVPGREILRRLAEHWELSASEPNYLGEVAKRYRYADDQGEVGFITSMTQPFCGNCTRLRVGADGQAFRCLFADKSLDIKPLLDRGDYAGVKAALEEFWHLRDDRYSELRGSLLTPSERREMYQMGG